MNGFRVGLGNEIVNSRYSATAFARADYLTAAAAGLDSYWLGDHLNSLFPGRFRHRSTSVWRK